MLCSTRDHHFIVDGPIQNSAPGEEVTPVEMFLSAVAAQLALAIERKQLEGTLQKERAFLRTLIDNLPDSVYVKDMASRKIIANLSEVRLSGVQSEAEILGKDDFAFHPKELAEQFLAGSSLLIDSWPRANSSSRLDVVITPWTISAIICRSASARRRSVMSRAMPCTPTGIPFS